MPEADSKRTTLNVPVGTALVALTGMLTVAVSLLAFILDLLVTPETEVGALIASFVVCGAGLTAGLMLLRRLLPKREPISLFAGSSVPVSASTKTERPALSSECSQDAAKSASEIRISNIPISVDAGQPRTSVSRYKARDGIGALGLLCTVGVSLILGGRLRGGWEFLSFVVPAGCVVALALAWSRGRKDLSIASYAMPVSGGMIGTTALIGVGLVMSHFHFLRVFLGLAVVTGVAIALGLNWAGVRRQNSSSSLV